MVRKYIYIGGYTCTLWRVFVCRRIRWSTRRRPSYLHHLNSKPIFHDVYVHVRTYSMWSTVHISYIWQGFVPYPSSFSNIYLSYIMSTYLSKSSGHIIFEYKKNSMRLWQWLGKQNIANYVCAYVYFFHIQYHYITHQ